MNHDCVTYQSAREHENGRWVLKLCFFWHFWFNHGGEKDFEWRMTTENTVYTWRVTWTQIKRVLYKGNQRWPLVEGWCQTHSLKDWSKHPPCNFSLTAVDIKSLPATRHNRNTREIIFLVVQISAIIIWIHIHNQKTVCFKPQIIRCNL